MINIIEFANKTIDSCLHCQLRPNCKWFGIVAENVILDDITPEEYASLTYEEIATKIHSNAGSPECEDQHSIDGLLEIVEGMLEQATIPNFSQELITLLNKMSRLEKRLKRLPDDCRDVFDASTRAIVERCLSAIDYTFLDSGIDVYPLIQNIHSDYRRTKMLHQYYLEGVVNVLLAKAKKLTLEQIVSWKDALWKLRESKINEVSEPKPVPRKYDPLDKKPYNKTWVEDISKTINDRIANDFLCAIIAYMGYTPYNCFAPMYDEVREYYISKGFAPPELFVPYRTQNVYDEIYKAVKEKKDDELALKMYFTDILSPFAMMSSSLFAKPQTENNRAIQGLMKLAGKFRYQTIEQVKERWEKAIAEVGTTSDKAADIHFYDKVAELMLQKYDDVDSEHKTIEYGPFAHLGDLLWLIRELETCIEAALLKNNIPHDYLFYEDYAKVSLGESVNDLRVAEMTRLTPAAVQHLSKELNHKINYILFPGENIADYNNRMLAKHGIDNGNTPPSPLPEDFKSAQKYLDVMKNDGLLTPEYKWAKKKGTTNYHAARAAQVIITNCPEITYSMLSQLFGIPNVGSYTSLAKEKETVRRLIEQLFRNQGLSTTVS